MAEKSRQELKAKFRNGDEPSQEDFGDLIDSFRHKTEASEIEDNIASQSEAEQGQDNTKVMTPLRARQATNYLKASRQEAGEGTASDKLMTPLRTKQAIEIMTRLQNLTQLAADVSGEINKAINTLIDNAPENLNTLNELASALNDDANAVASINSALSQRYTKTEVNAFFEGTSNGRKQVHWARITGKPSTFVPNSHNHDDRYYTENEIDTFLEDRDSKFTSDIFSDINLNNINTPGIYRIQSSSVINTPVQNNMLDDKIRVTRMSNKTNLGEDIIQVYYCNRSKYERKIFFRYHKVTNSGGSWGPWREYRTEPKSDSITSDSSESLATSKSVYTLAQRGVKRSGTVATFDLNGYGTQTITHNLGHTNYLFIATLRFTSRDHLTDETEENNFWVINKTANTVQIRTCSNSSDIFYVDWAVI